MDAVVAGQVARRLAGGDDVVRGDAVLAVRQRNFVHRRAERLVHVERRAHGCFDFGIQARARNARGPSRFANPASGWFTVCEYGGTGTSSDVESRGSCPAIASNSSATSSTDWPNGPTWSRLLAKRHEAVAAHAAVGRLHADDAAQAGRLADRAARVGADRQRRHAGGDAAAEPPLEPPGDALEVPRIARHLKRRVLGRAAHRELVHVRPADEHGVGRREASR